jgi:hypothetical protein
VAFARLLQNVASHRYGIELDANRAEQARAVGIETLQANAMDVRCQPEAVSLLYSNPPYDWEFGESNNQRLESVSLEHSYRWLKAGGVLLFVIPQLRLAKCARLLSEHFTDLRVFRLTEPACLQYKQIVVLATRRKRHPSKSQGVLCWILSLTPRVLLKAPWTPRQSSSSDSDRNPCQVRGARTAGCPGTGVTIRLELNQAK